MERRNLETKEGVWVNFRSQFPSSTDKTNPSWSAPWAWRAVEAIEINLNEWSFFYALKLKLRSDNLGLFGAWRSKIFVQKMTSYGLWLILKLRIFNYSLANKNALLWSINSPGFKYYSPWCHFVTYFIWFQSFFLYKRLLCLNHWGTLTLALRIFFY